MIFHSELVIGITAGGSPVQKREEQLEYTLHYKTYVKNICHTTEIKNMSLQQGTGTGHSSKLGEQLFTTLMTYRQK
jgi:hypothetical protein